MIRLGKNQLTLHFFPTFLLKPILNEQTGLTGASAVNTNWALSSYRAEVSVGDRSFLIRAHVYLLYAFVLQSTSDFSLVKSDAGEVVTEDGRSRCPFNPEYKSTAIVAGRSRGGGGEASAAS